MWVIVRYHCAYCSQCDKARVSIIKHLEMWKGWECRQLSRFDCTFNDQMLVENQLGGRSFIGPSVLWVWGLWRIFYMIERPWDWRCRRVGGHCEGHREWTAYATIQWGSHLSAFVGTSQNSSLPWQPFPSHLQKSKTLRNFRLKISPQIPL